MPRRRLGFLGKSFFGTRLPRDFLRSLYLVAPGGVWVRAYQLAVPGRGDHLYTVFKERQNKERKRQVPLFLSNQARFSVGRRLCAGSGYRV